MPCAVDPELVAEEPLAVDELADQRLAGRHVGVGLDPHAPLGNDRPVGRRLPDTLVQGRVTLLDHVEQVTLAVEEAIGGILPRQGELVGQRAGGLSLGLGQGPQPRHVEVGVPEGEHRRDRRAIRARQHPRQPLAAGAKGGRQLIGRQFEVGRHRAFTQGLVDLGGAKRVGVEMVSQFQQAGHVQPKLVGLFVPEAERGFGYGLLGGRGLWYARLAVLDGSDGTDSRPVVGVGLDQDVEGIACPGASPRNHA